MPRKGHTQKRDVLADPLYNNKVVTKLINNIMLDGKKGVAQKIVYGAFDRVAAESGKDAIEVFEEAMNNIMPVLEVKAKRIGGATYQVPIEVKPERRQALALRWITLYSRKRGEKTQEERLAKEILDAANNTGASVKKKEDMHKMGSFLRSRGPRSGAEKWMGTMLLILPGRLVSTMIRSAMLTASARSWVIRTAVFFVFRRMVPISSQTVRRV